MSTVEVTESSRGHFQQLTIQNDVLALTVMPQLGGKISSIRDLRTGREWLWANPHIQYHTVDAGASYIREGDTGGWDECFPTVAPCSYPCEPWKGVALPDHGELWSQPWVYSIQSDPSGGKSIRTEVRGRRLPYVFHRCIRLVPGQSIIRIEYTVENRSTSAVAFIWSAHPLFRLEPGMRVAVPQSATVRVYSTIPTGLLGPGDRYAHPVNIQIVDKELQMAGIPNAAPGIAFKLWSEPLDEGWAELHARDGVVRFVMDPTLPPQIAVWTNWGGWSGIGSEPYFNLGLEPCTGAQDSLEEAVNRYKLHAMLPAGGVRAWWLEAHVEARPAHES